MAKHIVSRTSLVVATPDQVSTDLAGKTAVLGLKNRTYYTLDEVGSPIWDMVQTEQRVEDIHGALVRRFDVEPDQCERDLLAFLQQLADQDLIRVK